MKKTATVIILASLLVLPCLTRIMPEQPPPPDRPDRPNPADEVQEHHQPEEAEVEGEPYLLRFVKGYGMFSTPALPGDNAMCSWKDGKGNLYIALKADKELKDGEIIHTGGGIAIVSPEGRIVTLDGKSRPFYPGDTIMHAWGGEDGRIYISTGTRGLVIIDTKKTPMNPGDDTAKTYSLCGVFDTTEGGEPKVIARSPCLGCDLVTYSWMDPETKNLYVCAGAYDTYEGGLIVLVWDARENDFTKSYTYRALNWRLKKTREKVFQHAVFDTTSAFRQDKNEPRGGKFIKEFKLFGHNQNCRRVWKDSSDGLIYVSRHDTLNADLEAVNGFNRDGGLTIIDTRKTPDPIDDTVTVLNPWNKPYICGTYVTHFRKDAATGCGYVSMMDLNPIFEEEMSGVTVLTGGADSLTFRRSGKYDTSGDRRGKKISLKAGILSPQVYMTLKDPKTDEILVFHAFGLDVISKDLKRVSKIGLDDFTDLPRSLSGNSITVADVWIDDDGLIYMSLGASGNGLLVFKREKPDS